MNKDILKISKLSEELARVHVQLCEALQDKWPMQSIVKFWFRSGQSNPSSGRVVGYWHGCVQVIMDSQKAKVKHVHWSKILS